MKTDSTDKPNCPLCVARWNPYLVGAGIGLLSMAVFWLADNPLGISTGLSQASGACAAAFVGWEKVGANAYWAKHVPKWDYGTLFLVGTFLGGLVAAVLGKSFRMEAVPSVWRERFGPSVLKRMAGAVLGGVLVMYGARLAGGCTSGHGVCGLARLSLRSLVATGTFLGVAIVTTFVARHLLGLAA